MATGSVGVTRPRRKNGNIPNAHIPGMGLQIFKVGAAATVSWRLETSKI